MIPEPGPATLPRDAEWIRDEQGLSLRMLLEGQALSLRAEFLRGPMGYRLRKGGGRGEAVARAIGLKKGAGPFRVVDATAGLGRDAFLLAWLGCEVTALERSAPIHALLADAWRRAQLDPEVCQKIGERLQIRHADGAKWLGELLEQPRASRPEVVYLDPMHPDRHSSGKVRKEMRLFRQLVGEDLDALELFEAARLCATRRIVVKRPRKGEPLAPGVSHRLEGKSTRFDIYLAKSESNPRDPACAVD